MRTVEIISIGFLIGINLLTEKKNKKFSSVVLLKLDDFRREI